MRAVITVVGSDKIGIVYEVVKKMVEFDLNIVDITPVSYTHLTLPTICSV